MTIDGIRGDGNLTDLLDIVHPEHVGASRYGSSASRCGGIDSLLRILLTRDVTKELFA